MGGHFLSSCFQHISITPPVQEVQLSDTGEPQSLTLSLLICLLKRVTAETTNRVAFALLIRLNVIFIAKLIKECHSNFLRLFCI